jgi:hypothetical protein
VSHLELSFELPYPELESRLLAIFRNASLAVRVSAEREECYGCSFESGIGGDSTKILLSPLALHVTLPLIDQLLAELPASSRRGARLRFINGILVESHELRFKTKLYAHGITCEGFQFWAESMEDLPRQVSGRLRVNEHGFDFDGRLTGYAYRLPMLDVMFDFGAELKPVPMRALVKGLVEAQVLYAHKDHCEPKAAVLLPAALVPPQR